MLTAPARQFRLRSFVRRDSRLTAAQGQAFTSFWPQYGLALDGQFNLMEIFGRPAPCYLEIGFGSGVSLIEAAKANPDKNFIGVETYKPGIGALFIAAHQNALSNLRVCYGDAIDVLEKCIPDGSLNGIQIFFPDPWPKRRHHARRLIQPAFVQKAAAKLAAGGSLHLATDWEDYAVHMLQVVSAEKDLLNAAGNGQFAGRSPLRPVITKFERRAMQEGRGIRDLQLTRR